MKPILSGQNQLASLPISISISVWLLMQHFNVQAIWYGVYWTIVIFWFLAIIVGFIISLARGRKRFEVDEDGNITVK